MRRYIITILLFLVFPGLISPYLGCESPVKKYYDSVYTPEIYSGAGYELSNPDTVVALPPTLNEISGLSYYNDSLLLAVEDEKGKIYLVNANTGHIENEIHFGKNGDYEGIELVNNVVHIVKSNGKIYSFKLELSKSEIASEEMKNSLTSKNDVEGLAYDKLHNRMLIACKGQGETGRNEAKGKCIYALDIDGMKLEDKPVFSIRKKQIKALIEKDYPELKLKSSVGPSGIAVHPITGNIYILAHIGKALIVMDQKGQILRYHPLNPSLFQQPEGICFTPTGDMYISNEARNRKPNLMKFSYHL